MTMTSIRNHDNAGNYNSSYMTKAILMKPKTIITAIESISFLGNQILKQ